MNEKRTKTTKKGVVKRFTTSQKVKLHLYKNQMTYIMLGFVAIGVFGTWWMLILALIALAGYKIYRGWDLIQMAGKHTEYKLWGRPLEKEYWTKEEWANRPRFKPFGNFKFEWIPSTLSTSTYLPFRVALYLSAYFFCYFAIGWFFHYPYLNYFASLYYICAIFVVTFILLQVMGAAKVIYERRKNKNK